MEDIEICTNCHQSFEVTFNDRTSDYVLSGPIYFFCHDCYNLFFDKTLNYDNNMVNESLELPIKTLEFIDKDGLKIEFVQKGYLFLSIKQMDINGNLIYEKLFLSLESPQQDCKDIRKYVVRNYYNDGTLKYESFRIGYYEKYRERYINYTSPIKEWYPNGVLESEMVPNVYEKKWDTDGYLLIDNKKGDRRIYKTWYKDLDMCLVKTEFMDYYGDVHEDIHVIDRSGNKFEAVFDKLDNLVPYTKNSESNECRILNNQYDDLYRQWFYNGIITKDIFREYPRINWGNEIIELNGNYKIYNLKGILVEEVSYLKNKLNGVYRKRDWDSGILLREYNFEKGRFNGLCKEWSESGILLREYNYMKNKFSGLCREWFESGILKKEHNYKDHKFEGICNEYDESGELKKSGDFINGKFINESGKKVKIKKMDVISKV